MMITCSLPVSEFYFVFLTNSILTEFLLLKQLLGYFIILCVWVCVCVCLHVCVTFTIVNVRLSVCYWIKLH